MYLDTEHLIHWKLSPLFFPMFGICISRSRYCDYQDYLIQKRLKRRRTSRNGFCHLQGGTGKRQPTQRLAGAVGPDPTRANPEEANRVSNKYALSQWRETVQVFKSHDTSLRDRPGFLQKIPASRETCWSALWKVSCVVLLTPFPDRHTPIRDLSGTHRC